MREPPFIGAQVDTDYSGKVTRHTVTQIESPFRSESGIGVRVEPVVSKSDGGVIDWNWFELAKPEESNG